MTEKNYISIGTKVTPTVKKALDKFLESEDVTFINSADYLRQLVKNDLKRRGFIKGETE